MPAPTITHLSWGKIETSDGCSFKDLKIWPGGAREWNWNETGTRHSPGIQIADVKELVENGVTRVILSCGMLRMLRVQTATVDWLLARGVEAEVLPTRQGVEKFNELRTAGVAVGGLFHSTC